LKFYFPRFLFLIFFLISFSQPVFANGKTETKFTLEHFSYAGPMAVLQLANDWHGDLKKQNDAVSFIQGEFSFAHKGFQIGIVRRMYHQFEIDNDLARGFYYYNNKIELDQRMQINANMTSRVYSGSGLRIGYEFDDSFGAFFEHLKITPSIVALRLDDIIWGGFDGDLYYSSTDDWGGTIDLNYGYTKDHIARRKLPGDYLGWLYGLDLGIDWQSPWLDLKYEGINVLSRIYWDGMPRTTAQISTETAFYLLGHEYFEDVILNAPALHYLEAAAPFSIFSSATSNFNSIYWFSSAQVTPIKSFYYHGLQIRTAEIKLGIQYDFDSNTSKISLEHANAVMEFASQTLDVSRSQQIVMKLGLRYLF